jgi:hypothetical protein
MNRALRTNLGGADGEQTVQKRVTGRGCFETRDGAEIAVRVVSDARERHVNQAAVVGLESDPQVERHHAVASSGDPVAAARKHLAAKPLALERATRDGENRQRAQRRRAIS